MRIPWWPLLRGGAIAIVGSRLARTLGAAPPLRPDTPPLVGSDGADVTVVIPARNEVGRIRPAIAAARNAVGVSEVVVVDDRSTDATAAVARASGARVVGVGERPTGWAGKTWALQVGAAATDTDWVLFLDADVRVSSGLPPAMTQRAIADRLDLLSVAARLAPGDALGRWLHASMLTTLVYRFGAPGTGGRMLSNGQCVLVRRRAFDEWGGLAPVAESWVEDVALARWLAGRGRRVAFVDACDLVEVEPYDSLVATWSGWGRSLGLSGVDGVLRRTLDVVVLTLVMPVPLVRMLVGRADVIDVVAAALRAGTLVGTRRAFTRTGAAFWCSPLADIASVASLATSVVQRRHRWRGRVST